MHKIIILGGAGFIGTNLGRSALGRGLEVVVFDNLSRKGTDINLRLLRECGPVTFIQGDIRRREDVEALFRAHGDADAVFHLAGQVAVTTSIQDPRDDFDINLYGTLNVLEAMRQYQIQAPLLYASTNKVYGKMAQVEIIETQNAYAYRDYPHGINEDFPLDFYSPYGCSKGGADQYVLDYARIYGLNTVVMRQSCIYGYYQFGIEDQGWVAWFTIASLFDMPITLYGTGKQVRDVLFVDDLIAAYWLAVEQIDLTNGQAFNVGGGEFRLSLLALLAHLETAFNKKIKVGYGEPRQGDQKVFISDTRKAAQTFGWQPQISVEQGVGRLAEWAVANQA